MSERKFLNLKVSRMTVVNSLRAVLDILVSEYIDRRRPETDIRCRTSDNRSNGHLCFEAYHTCQQGVRWRVHDIIVI